MVVPMPALFLGGFAVWMVMSMLTYVVLRQIVKMKRETPKLGGIPVSDNDLFTISGAVGVVFVVIMILLLLTIPREWAIGVLLALTVIGVLFGLSTFFW